MPVSAQRPALLVPIGLLAFVALLALPSCGKDDSPDAGIDPDLGATTFWSADGMAGQDSSRGGEEPGLGAPDNGAMPPGDDRTVEEGDIYRLLGDSRVLNLNVYRGLQVIDFSDVDAPRIVGRAALTGTPVELYVVGDMAYVLLNEWSGYRVEDGALDIAPIAGGLIVSVDLKDPSSPTVVDRAVIPGQILRSRVVRDSTRAALYVAASAYGEFEDDQGNATWGTRSWIRSFGLDDGRLVPRSELDLGGYVTDIQATPRALLVARGTDLWWSRGEGSTVRIIDISNPDGSMVPGDEVRATGQVFSQFNMDLHGDILRVVSGSRWGSSPTNQVQTWNATDFGNLVPIDESTFGNPNEDLYATLFLGNKAFFVTYFRVDPFHAFEITDEGIATERSEFIVSGWNDFFRAVAGETRLIGIGMNDEHGGQRAAVSLYDITDLDNAEPLIDRAEVEASWTWSEANWDHRAFSVLEDAVAVTAADGTDENGLILLPYSGWDPSLQRYVSAVQVFTFSPTTLTRRGTMEHPSAVRRSFLSGPDLATNLSDTDLAFVDLADPDLPVPRGAVELAPNYTDLLPLDSRHRIRVRERTVDAWDYQGDNQRIVELISADEHPDYASPMDARAFGMHTRVTVVGAHIAVTEISPDNDRTATIHVLAVDDGRLTPLGSVSTDRLPLRQYWGDAPGIGRPGIGMPDIGWGWWGYNLAPEPAVVGDQLVYVEYAQQSRVIGQARTCDTWIRDSGGCASSPVAPGEDPRDTDEDERICTWISGWRSCTTIDGRTVCSEASPQQCTWSAGTPEQCEPLTWEDVQTRESCYDWEMTRFWNQAIFHPVDLSNPASPAVRDAISMPRDHEAVAVLVHDDALWFNWRVPADRPGDARPHVQYFARRAALDGTTHGPAINIPGSLLAIDGATIYTHDTVYGERIIESAVNRLTVIDDRRARLDARRRFEDRVLSALLLDGDGRVLVADQPAYRWGGGWGGGWDGDVAVSPGVVDGPTLKNDHDAWRLLILNDDDAFAPRAEARLPAWSSLVDARPGQAFLRAANGVLVVDTRNPDQPAAQAFLSARGWPDRILVDGDHVIFTAGRFGIYRFDAGERNLAP